MNNTTIIKEFTLLTQLILDLYEAGEVYILPGPIAELFSKDNWHVTEEEVRERFGDVLGELFNKKPGLAVHPFSLPYIEAKESERDLFNNLSPEIMEKSIAGMDDEFYKFAYHCLPFRQKTAGLRFPPNGENDYLYRVYLEMGKKRAAGTMRRVMRRTVYAHDNGIISAPAMQNIIKGALKAIPQGINGVATLQNKKARKGLEDLQLRLQGIEESWDQNFRKTKI
jgi:hypothetical protein